MAISVFDMRKHIVHIALLNKLLLCNLKCLTNNPLTDGKREVLIYLVLSFWMERGGRTDSTAYGVFFVLPIKMMGL